MAFYMVGDITEVQEKADKMAKDIAARKVCVLEAMGDDDFGDQDGDTEAWHGKGQGNGDSNSDSSSRSCVLSGVWHCRLEAPQEGGQIAAACMAQQDRNHQADGLEQCSGSLEDFQ